MGNVSLALREYHLHFVLQMVFGCYGGAKDINDAACSVKRWWLQSGQNAFRPLLRCGSSAPGSRVQSVVSLLISAPFFAFVVQFFAWRGLYLAKPWHHNYYCPLTAPKFWHAFTLQLSNNWHEFRFWRRKIGFIASSTHEDVNLLNCSGWHSKKFSLNRA